MSNSTFTTDASSITAKKRLIAIRKNALRFGISQSSYESSNKHSVKTALTKVRGGGSVAPAKKGFHF